MFFSFLPGTILTIIKPDHSSFYHPTAYCSPLHSPLLQSWASLSYQPCLIPCCHSTAFSPQWPGIDSDSSLSLPPALLCSLSLSFSAPQALHWLNTLVDSNCSLCSAFGSSYSVCWHHELMRWEMSHGIINNYTLKTANTMQLIHVNYNSIIWFLFIMEIKKENPMDWPLMGRAKPHQVLSPGCLWCPSNLSNLHCWSLVNTPAYSLCQRKGTLEHILSCCPKVLGKGWYLWQHVQLLKTIAEGICSAITSCWRSKPLRQTISFIRAGEKPKSTPNTGFFKTAQDWQLTVELGK